MYIKMDTAHLLIVLSLVYLVVTLDLCMYVK
jgi:hypothetical protein